MFAEIAGVCAGAAALVALAVCLDRQTKRRHTKRWCARPVQDEDTLKAMQERRRAAIEAAGESWLLHPSKSVKRRRKPRKPGVHRA
jgi:hypothetical protein